MLYARISALVYFYAIKAYEDTKKLGKGKIEIAISLIIGILKQKGCPTTLL
jgi:hypothetical protein